MVDAISGLQPHSRAMSSSHARESGSRSIIKAEPVEDDEDAEQRWKDLPPAHLSPLSQKSNEAAALPEPTEQEPQMRSSAPTPSLLANSRKRRESTQRPPSGAIDLETAIKKMEDLDIYDFKESSSPLTDSSSVASTGLDNVRAGKASGAGAARSHRRHSSVPKAIDSLPDVATGDVTGMEEKTFKGSVRAASRRRSMML